MQELEAYDLSDFVDWHCDICGKPHRYGDCGFANQQEDIYICDNRECQKKYALEHIDVYDIASILLVEYKTTKVLDLLKEAIIAQVGIDPVIDYVLYGHDFSEANMYEGLEDAKEQIYACEIDRAHEESYYAQSKIKEITSETIRN